MDFFAFLALLGVLVVVFGFGYWMGWHDGYLEYKMMVDVIIKEKLDALPH